MSSDGAYPKSSRGGSFHTAQATALPPCPATPLPTFVVTRSVPSMVSPSCTGGLGGPTTAASTCYTTTSGSCFTDGPGNYGNNERCSITVQRRTGLAVQNGWVVPAGDYFFLTGSATRYTTAASLNSLVLNAGDVINWYSSFTRTGAGYVICVRAPILVPNLVPLKSSKLCCGRTLAQL